MKSKGFTLVELLAVISILSLLALITSTVISNSLKEAKKDLTETQKESIKLATQAWGSDNINKLPTSGNCAYITIQDLIDDGYLESKIINPETKEEISSDLKIKISSQQSKKNLIYEVNSSSINDCSYIGQTIHIDLPKGLTPVVYDEGKNLWRVPNASEEWYNYDEQKWANAVVLGKGKSKKAGETVTVEGETPEALMMLVYIPRYEYKIEGQYGKHSDGTVGTQELPGEIKVNFISKNTTVPTEGYHINSAFTFDGEKSGFWVGKFELSHTTRSYSSCNCTTINCSEAQNLRIIPGKSSLKTNTVSSYWYGIKSIENTALFGFSNIDIHMMKNSEWGAVAYLSQSKYGKYGNKDYEGYQKEVYINNSVYDYTGRSGGNPGGSTPVNETYVDQSLTDNYSKYGYYTYDGYLLNYDTNTKTEKRDINKGAGASTTGNIYGVYDMSGGAWEYVMGAYGTEEDGVYSGYTISSNSGFNGRTGNDSGNVTTALSLPDLKYYDMYTNATNRVTNDGSLSCKNGSEYGVCYGHAISETGGWYKDYNNVVIPSYPWFGRGGYCKSNASAGVFDRTVHYGNKSDNATTRVVGIVK